jgi:neutral ceramidase
MSAPVLAVGVAVEDITPPPGLSMAGFAARVAPATGAHDPLTVRALAVGDTVLAIADVIGLHEDACARIRRAAPIADHAVVLAATHTHGGPVSMPGRIGTGHDADYAARLERATARAIERALAARQPARLFYGQGSDPGVAKNRRHAGGTTDAALPVLLFRGLDGAKLAVLTCYACHPVVLGADNLLWTADYPGYVRRGLEQEFPGAVALFATGCTGDANTGHSAASSNTIAAQPRRTYAAAEGYAARIVAAARAAPLAEISPSAAPAVRERYVALDLAREQADPAILAASWRAERANADTGRARLLDYWIAWAEGPARQDLTPWNARVSRLDWGGVTIVTLPGEVFAETALSIRAALGPRTLVIAYGEGVPGYIAPASEWPHGGYEVAEAHRFYAMPGPFAPGSAERLASAAVD